MSAFAGIRSPSVLLADNRVNAYFDDRTKTTVPFVVWAIAKSRQGTKSAKWVQDTVHLALDGAHAHAFLDDWYYRIHVTSSHLSLGNVVSDIVARIGIWNAWPDRTQILTEFVGSNDAGITVATPGDPPMVFPPLAEYFWIFTIGIDGPPNVDADFRWTFADGEEVDLNITGSRITAWAARPDWSNGVKESLAHLTDVKTAETGTEVRRKLRSTPRRTFEFDFLATGNERRYIESALYAWTAMVWALPIWPDGQRLTVANAIDQGALEVLLNTRYRDFVAGGLAIVIASAANYEVMQVDQVADGSITLVHPTAKSWPAGSRIFPARTARLTKSPTLTRAGAGWQGGNVSFMLAETSHWSTVTGLPKYRGVDVLEILPDTDGEQDSYEREFDTIDSSTGQVETDDTAGMGFPITGFEFFSVGAAKRAQLRSILYSLAGKQGELWVPTWKADLELAATVLDNSNSIDIANIGYTLFIQAQMNRRDIRIEMKNGTIYYRRIVGSTTDNPTTERLSLDSNFTTGFTVDKVRRISYMMLSRQINDETVIEHTNMVDGLAMASTGFRGVNHDV